MSCLKTLLFDSSSMNPHLCGLSIISHLSWPNPSRYLQLIQQFFLLIRVSMRAFSMSTGGVEFANNVKQPGYQSISLRTMPGMNPPCSYLLISAWPAHSASYVFTGQQYFFNNISSLLMFIQTD